MGDKANDTAKDPVRVDGKLIVAVIPYVNGEPLPKCFPDDVSALRHYRGDSRFFRATEGGLQPRTVETDSGNEPVLLELRSECLMANHASRSKLKGILKDEERAFRTIKNEKELAEPRKFRPVVDDARLCQFEQI